ncbi:hypothetical protein [Fructobacillus ficulneus]|uniref:Uncharacterized protein n=1 Tax=Fructobacillus ficulneus TaxID=157463 RepID=A0A0K8MHN4_9LACO|nr:hypothetical protein [Fructobacillus ficulneus]GAP00061.1 hypothetical protein FFIC_280660 [Fructobacillus ficulneus]
MTNENTSFIAVSLLILLVQALIAKFTLNTWTHYILPVAFALTFLFSIIFIGKDDAHWVSLLVLLVAGDSLLLATANQCKATF